MELPGSGYLYTLAVLAMTFVGFCAIVLAFRHTTKTSPTNVLHSHIYIELGFSAAGFAMLPRVGNFRTRGPHHLALFKPNHCRHFGCPDLFLRSPRFQSDWKALSAYVDQLGYYNCFGSYPACECCWVSVRAAIRPDRSGRDVAARSWGGGLYADLRRLFHEFKVG